MSGKYVTFAPLRQPDRDPGKKDEPDSILVNFSHASDVLMEEVVTLLALGVWPKVWLYLFITRS